MTEEIDGVEEGGTKRHSRRDVLKKGAVGAGVAGVVWAAPEIVGLASGPSYASASSHSVSNIPCSGDAGGNVGVRVPIPCPPGGHASQDIVIAGGNCAPQAIIVDTHWAVGTPKDSTVSRPNAFNDVHAQDKAPWKTFHEFGSSDMSNDRPPYLITSVKRANANCSFNGANVVGTNTFLFNPVTKQKFNNGALSVADFAVGWASDPNERADLGAPLCEPDKTNGTAAFLKIHCV